MARRRSKYGVTLRTEAVDILAAEIVAQKGLSKKAARHIALLEVYPNRSFEGKLFASEWECTRWQQLQDLERRGEILALVAHQPVFKLEVNGHVIATYTPDSSYVITATGEVVVEDAKSKSTEHNDLFQRNRKHIRAQYGVEITVAQAPKPERKSRRKNQ